MIDKQAAFSKLPLALLQTVSSLTIKYLLHIRSLALVFISFIPSLLIRILFPRSRLCNLRTERTGHLMLEPDLYFTSLLVGKTARAYERLVFIPSFNVCNEYLLDLIGRIVVPGLSVRILSSQLAAKIGHLLLRSPLLKNHCLSIALNNEGYGAVLDAPCLLLPTESELSLLNSWLSNHYNYNEANPCILLHNRDAAFLPGLYYHRCRDFAPNAFFPVIKKYSESFNFIRGGSIAIEPLPENLEGCIDMPFTKHSDLTSILIHHKSLFYFGSDSGIFSISLGFRKPLAIINFPPNIYGKFRNNNCFRLGFIPKKMINKYSRSYIGLVEMYERNLVNFWSSSHFADADIELVDNSEEEVLQFFEESLSIYQNQFDKSPIYTEEQEEFWRIVAHYEPDNFQGDLIKENFFVGTGFLRRNHFLLSS